MAGALVVAIGALAYAAFQTGLYHPTIAKTGSVTAVSEVHPGQSVTAPTRLAIVGRRSFWQVKVAQGTWEDCGTDCAVALRHYVFHE